MAVQYYLTPNHMTTDPDDFMAVTVLPEVYDLEDVFDHMTRGGSTITKAEALAAFEEISHAIVTLLGRGHGVNTPLVNFKPSIRGRFESDEDRFDPGRHQKLVKPSPGTRLRHMAGDIEVEKIPVREREPAPVHYYDHASEEQDEVITPNDGARLSGSLLKFDMEDEEQGIFFINVDDGEEIKADGTILRNKPGEILFNNPELPPGTYRLEVRSNLGSTKIRTGTLSDELTVVGT